MPKRCRLTHAFLWECGNVGIKGWSWPDFWANLASFSPCLCRTPEATGGAWTSDPERELNGFDQWAALSTPGAASPRSAVSTVIAKKHCIQYDLRIGAAEGQVEAPARRADHFCRVVSTSGLVAVVVVARQPTDQVGRRRVRGPALPVAIQHWRGGRVGCSRARQPIRVRARARCIPAGGAGQCNELRLGPARLRAHLRRSRSRPAATRIPAHYQPWRQPGTTFRGSSMTHRLVQRGSGSG